MFDLARRLATLWPTRLLAAIVACACLLSAAPSVVVHAHDAAVAGHHHHTPADDADPASGEPRDPAKPHFHDACCGAAVAAASLPSTLALPAAASHVAGPDAAAPPSAPPDFLHRPPIA